VDKLLQVHLIYKLLVVAVVGEKIIVLVLVVEEAQVVY
jgi:hypothetical protein